MQRTTKNPKGSSSRTNPRVPRYRYARLEPDTHILYQEAGKSSFEKADPEKTHITPIFIKGCDLTIIISHDHPEIVRVIEPITGREIYKATNTPLDVILDTITKKLTKIGGHQGLRIIIDEAVDQYRCSPAWRMIRPSFITQRSVN